MELKDFIKNSLIDIKEGVDSANEQLGKDKFAIESYQDGRRAVYITFDVAVVASEESSSGGGAKINIQVVDVGGKLEKTTKQEFVNRIEIPVAVYNEKSLKDARPLTGVL